MLHLDIIMITIKNEKNGTILLLLSVSLPLSPRVKPPPPPWLPVLEKHDIPIVVGVGVSLAFIFITMAFYSLVQKNEPAPAIRGQWADQLNLCWISTLMPIF